MDVGTKLKLMREEYNFSQEYVANVLEIAQSTYCALEGGKTKLTVDRAKKLAELYDIPASFFYTDDQPATNYNIGKRSRSIFHPEIYNEEMSGVRDLYERVIAEKNQQIELLNKQLVDCKAEKEYLKRIVESKLV